VTLFFLLFAKILPLYITIFFGYLSSRFLSIERESVATLLFYVIGPVVIFNATMVVEMNLKVGFLPIFAYLLSSMVAFTYLAIYEKKWPDPTGNILAFTAGTGNTGYFGIALALILFEQRLADIFIFTVLGSLFYETTTGYYVTAKGKFTARQSMQKVFRLPALYAFVLAIFLRMCGVTMPESVALYTGQFKVVFTILGMMIIGMGLHGFGRGKSVDMRFLKVALCSKHILWPFLIIALIFFDKVTFNVLNEELYKVLFVFSIVPMAGNTVTLAVLFNAQPEKAAFTVLVSNLLSIFSIPLFLAIYDIV
jgi:predicted permease